MINKTKKISLFIIYLLGLINIGNTFASSALPGTLVSVNSSYNEHLLKDIINNYLLNPATTGNFTKGFASRDVPFQGCVDGECPIKNGCKLVQDDKSIEKYGFTTATCPSGTSVLYKDMGVYSQSGSTGMTFTCAVPIKEDNISTFIPRLDIEVEGMCEGGSLCKGIEPWYSVDNNNPVTIAIKVKPGSGDVTIGSTKKHIIDPVWLNTVKVYVNNYIYPIHKTGDYKTEGWDTITNIKLDGTGGVRGELGINYITIRACDHPIDEETGRPVESPDQIYKLNCTTKTIVVKLSPTTEKDVTKFSNLNQKKVNCEDFGIKLPDHAKWVFPVMLDGSFYQSCTEDGNCTPNPITVCNFQCDEGFVKDMEGPNGPGCYPEKELEDCNLSPVGPLKENEEWKAPNGFNSDQNVNPVTGQFYGVYDLEIHDYIPNVNYCQKGCKDGYKFVDGKCIPIQKQTACKNYFKLDNFKKYRAQIVTPDMDPDPNFTITQLLEETVDPSTGEMTYVYKPSDDVLKSNTSDNPCSLVTINNAIADRDTGRTVCKSGFAALDLDNNGIIGTCAPFNPSSDYLVFDSNNDPNLLNNPKEAIKNGSFKASSILPADHTSDCKVKLENIDYFYTKDKINACIK